MINLIIVNFTLTAVCKGLCKDRLPDIDVFIKSFKVDKNEVIGALNILLNKNILTFDDGVYRSSEDGILIAKQERKMTIDYYLKRFSSRTSVENINSDFNEYLYLNKDRCFNIFKKADI
jgi:hypothetical protein